MKKTIIALSTLALISCGSEHTDEEKEMNEEVIIVNDTTSTSGATTIDTSAIESEPTTSPVSTVTQEFWDSFKTDIKGIIYFTKTDSTFTEDKPLIDQLNNELNGVSNYKMYTNDNYAQIYLNDTLAFDITPFLLEHDKGFVLLKPHTMPEYQPSNGDPKVIEENVVSFFKS